MSVFDSKLTLKYKAACAYETSVQCIIYDEDNDEYLSVLNVVDSFIEEETDLKDIYDQISEYEKINPRILTYIYANILSREVDEDNNVIIPDEIFEKINDFLEQINHDTYNDKNALSEEIIKWIEQYEQDKETNVVVCERLVENEEMLKQIEPIPYRDININQNIETFQIRDKSGKDIDGIEIFNNSLATEIIPYIQYNDENGNIYYKIYKEFKNYETIVTFESENLDPNFIYFIVIEKSIKGKNIYFNHKFNLKDRNIKMSFDKRDVLKMENISLSFPSIELFGSKINKIKGSIIFDELFISESALHYLILTNEIFSAYLYIDESKSLSHGKRHLKIKCKTFSADENFEDKHSITIHFESDEEYGEIKPKAVKADFIAHSESVLNGFMEIFSRLLRVYMERVGKINARFKRIIPSLGEVKTEKRTRKVERTEINDTKLKNLKEKMPGIYDYPLVARTYCPCPNQPIIIKDNEVEDWENETFEHKNVVKKRTVLVHEDKFNIVCPDDRFPYPYLKRVDGKLIPCCRAKDEKELIKEEKGEIEEEEKTKSNYRVSILKVLKGKNNEAKIPILENLLKNSDRDDFIRIAIPLSPSSLIHCMLTAFVDMKYLEKNTNEEKEEYVKKIRKRIAKKILANVYKQELFDESDRSILSKVEDTTLFLDPYLFYRGVEEYFNANIFVFSPNKMINLEKGIKDDDLDDPMVEIPRHKMTHIRVRNLERRSVLIFKYLGQKDNPLDYPHCELIISKGEIIGDGANRNEYGKIPEVINNRTTYFTGSMNDKLFDILENSMHTYSWSFDKTVVMRDSPYSRINWNEFFLNIGELSGQKIDSYGKVTALELKLSKTIKIEISVIPTQPLNLPLIEESKLLKKRQIIEIFGNPTKTSDEGLYYPILDFQHGIFIRTEGEKGKYANKIIEYRNVKRNSSFLMQIINWLWKLSIVKKGELDEINSWWEKFVHKTNEKLDGDINMQRNFPVAKSTRDGLKKINGWWVDFFRNDGIYLYEELYEKAKVFFQREYVLIHGLPNKNIYMKVPEYLANFYMYSSDFTEKQENEIIVGRKNYKNWIFQRKKDIQSNDVNPIILSLDAKMYKIVEPFIYKDISTSKIYLVQNVSFADKSRVFNVCKEWNEKEVNIGFYSDKTYTTPPHLIYGLSLSGTIEIIEDNTDENENYCSILKWDKNAEKYSALIPIL